MTRFVKLDYVRSAADGIRNDLFSLSISVRKAAKILGISHSTLHTFIAATYNAPHQATLSKLLAAQCWSDDTRQSLEQLANYEELVFSGDIKASVKPTLAIVASGSGAG